MPEVAQATITVTPVLEGAQQSITEQLTGAAGDAGDKAGQESGSKFSGSLAKGLAKGTAAVTGAVAGVGAALIGAAGKTAEYGDEIDKASQKLGVSSTFYQEWEAVLEHSGTSMSSMTATFKKLATASQDATDDQVAAFEALGLSMDEVSSMSAEDLFSSVISGLQDMDEGTERTALATTLLGKGAMEMGALLNTSSEDTQAMIDRVHELGGVMSEDAVKASAQYQDSLQDMKTSLSGVANGLMADLLPSLSGFMDQVGDFVSTADLSPITDTLGSATAALGDFIAGLDIEAIGQTFQDVVAAVGDAVGLAWDVISQVFDSLSEAFDTITDALNDTGTDWDDVWAGVSDVVQTAADLVSAAISAIAEVIAWLVTEAQTDGTLINEVWSSITTALDAAVSIITDLIDMVTAILHGDWASAWESAQSIVETYTTAISTICTNIWNGIKDTATRLWNAIKTAITGPIDSAKTALTNTWNTIKTTISGVWDNLKTTATTKWDNIKSAVMSPIDSLKTALSNAWDTVKSVAEGAWDSIKSAITGPIESAKDTISGILDSIKGFFPLSIGRIFSDLKLPHISVSGGEAPFGIAGKGTPPSFSVSWYDKAMRNPYMFTDATLFGAGETGDEILYGRQALMEDIREAVGSGTVINNYFTVNGAEDPENYADRLARRLKLQMRMA